MSNMDSDVQDINVPYAILETLSGQMIIVIPELENALEPIFVTHVGSTIVVIFAQWENAAPPMLVTLSGIVILAEPHLHRA